MLGMQGIKGKLMFAFMGIAMISVVVGGLGYYYSSKVLKTYRSISQDNVPNLTSFIELKAVQVQIVIPVAAIAGTSSTPEDAMKAKAEIDNWVEKFDAASKDYEAAPFSEGEEQAWVDFKNKSWKPFLDMSYELARLSGTNNKADQKMRDKLFDNEYAQLRKNRKEAFDRLIKFQTDEVKKKEVLGDQQFKEMNIAVAGILILGFFVSLVISTLISARLGKDLAAAADAMTKGAEDVSLAVTQLNSATSELASTHQQAAAVQETAASVEEISAMVQKNSQNALDSAQVSERSKSKALDGKQTVDRMVNSMNEIQAGNHKIQEQIELSNQRFTEIVHVIQEIGGKTKVINDIVFQTKLLSFNASVEAARAGEHGKGFAVVAEEVGNLAQMSGTAAIEISALLEDSIKKVESVVNETKNSVGSLISSASVTVERGSQTASECGHTLEEIVGDVGHLSEMVASISLASQEQANGVREITNAVQEIDKSTQANAAASEQTAASVDQLSRLVDDLKDGANRLRAIVTGKSGEHERSVRAVPAKVTQGQARVLKLKTPQPASKFQYKKASGEQSVPSAEDPNFKDV
jgi:methyl-accepting chemotaxis protein